MTTYIKFLLFLAFYLLSPDIFATGVFDVVPTDKSKQYLGIIFGGSVGTVSLGGNIVNPMLSKMFERFNFIIVTAGVLIMSYIGVVAAINTAREGEAMGKKFSLWVPLRGLFGMLMMLPSPGTGYSVVQMTVIWIVLNGIGAANAVWNVVLDQLASGIRAVGAVDLPDLSGLVQTLTNNILLMSTCKNVLNQQLNLDVTQNYGPIKVNVAIGPITNGYNTGPNALINAAGIVVPIGGLMSYTQTATVSVGVESNQNTSSRGFDAICGSIPVTTTVSYSDADFSTANTTNRLQIKLNAIKAVFDTVSAAADALSPPPPTSLFIPAPNGPPGTFKSAYDNYMAQIVQLVAAPLNSNTQIANQVNDLKSFGWIHAGGYYFFMTAGAAAVIGDASTVPSADHPPPQASSATITAPPTYSDPLNTQLQTAANKMLLNAALVRAQLFAINDIKYTTPGLPALGSGSAPSGDSTLDRIIQVVMNGVRAPIIQFFQTALTGQTEDPLISIGKFGTGLMFAGEITTFTMIILSSVIMLGLSGASCISPLPFWASTLVNQIFPALMGAIVLLWTTGATLGVYVPMVPYLVFTATAIGWMIAVIEAVVGAPIIAIALVQPSGEELGNIKQALGILATVFLKPTLMIFGFVIAGSLLRGILTMINFGFVTALNTAVPNPTLFSIVPTLGLYVFLIVGVVNQSFSIIHILPTKVLGFAGIQAADGSPDKLMGEAKGGFDSSTKGAQEAQTGAFDAAKAKGQKKQEEGEKNKAEDERDARKKDLPNPPPQP